MKIAEKDSDNGSGLYHLLFAKGVYSCNDNELGRRVWTLLVDSRMYEVPVFGKSNITLQDDHQEIRGVFRLEN